MKKKMLVALGLTFLATSALAQNDHYLPALQGQANAQLAQGDEVGAIASFERILVIDPKQETVRSRLDLLRFRQVQSLIDTGQMDAKTDVGTLITEKFLN